MFALIVTLERLDDGDDRGWSWKERTETDQRFLLRRPDVISDLYIETLPSVSLQHL